MSIIRLIYFLGIGKKKQPNHLRDFNETFIRHGLITYKWGNITRSLKIRFHLHIICSLLGNLVRTTVYFENKYACCYVLYFHEII